MTTESSFKKKEEVILKSKMMMAISSRKKNVMIKAMFYLRKYFSAQAVFDSALKIRHRSLNLKEANNRQYDYLRTECAERLIDRLDDISRNFPKALEIGSYRGHLLDVIQRRNINYGESIRVGGIAEFIQSENGIILPDRHHAESYVDTSIMLTDETLSNIPKKNFNLVLSSLSMHWVNDLPLLFKNIQDVLLPDGAFIGCMLGGNTLQELRHCFYLAEQERKGGVSPHCSPFTRPADVSSLMQQAKFTLPTIDIDNIKVFMILYLLSPILHLFTSFRYRILMSLR